MLVYLFAALSLITPFVIGFGLGYAFLYKRIFRLLKNNWDISVVKDVDDYYNECYGLEHHEKYILELQSPDQAFKAKTFGECIKRDKFQEKLKRFNLKEPEKQKEFSPAQSDWR